MAERTATPDNSPDLGLQVALEFREFRGAMGARMDGFDRELRLGLEEIRGAIDDQDGDGSELRARLILVESKQLIVYRILGALGLLVAGAVVALVRTYFVGG